MIARHRRRDPFWDLEGVGARRSRRRRKGVAMVAFAVAITACGLTTAAWLLVLAPVLGLPLPG